MTKSSGFGLIKYGKKLKAKATYNGTEPSQEVIEKTCTTFVNYILNKLR